MSRLSRISGATRVVVALVVGAVLCAGITQIVTAGAVIPSVTYYACLNNGALTDVSTTAPTCHFGTQISWDSTGPQGVAGPQGPPGTAGGSGGGFNTCATPPAADLNYTACNLSDVDWAYLDLNQTVLTDANLTSADLDDAELGTQMQGADLIDVIARNASFLNANVVDTTWTDANLTNATFEGADLTSAVGLSTANLSNVNWENTTCPDGTNSNNDGDTCANNL
jgi:hypothetical protein